jgi:hypothetical protein
VVIYDMLFDEEPLKDRSVVIYDMSFDAIKQNEIARAGNVPATRSAALNESLNRTLLLQFKSKVWIPLNQPEIVAISGAVV